MANDKDLHSVEILMGGPAVGDRWACRIDGQEISHVTDVTLRVHAGDLPTVTIEKLVIGPLRVEIDGAIAETSETCSLCGRKIEGGAKE